MPTFSIWLQADSYEPWVPHTSFWFSSLAMRTKYIPNRVRSKEPTRRLIFDPRTLVGSELCRRRGNRHPTIEDMKLLGDSFQAFPVTMLGNVPKYL